MKIGVISSNLFCTPLLLSLQKSGAQTSVWAASGEQQQLLDWCRQNRVPAAAEKEPKDLYPWLKKQAHDLVFIIGYNQRIYRDKIFAPAAPIYNVHFGPLPGYRGPSPVFWQLKEGRKEIGLAIHELSDRMDAGGIVWMKAVINEPHFTYTFVHLLFSELLVEGVYRVIEGQNTGLITIAQEEKDARTYIRPQLADVLINWQEMTADEICHLIKACNAWNTGALTSFYGNELAIIDASAEQEKEAGQKPGTIINNKKQLSICCRDGQVLTVHYLRFNQLPFPGRWAAQLGMKTGQCLGT
jgi:methionyl-tRNA formyltransferase